MSAILAAVRPDEWNFPLFVHVLGAMTLLGGTLTAGVAQLVGWGRRDPEGAYGSARLAFWVLLTVAIPAWIVMRVGAEWIASKENLTGSSVPTWVEIGYVTAEPSGLLLLVATILTGLGARRLRRGGASTSRLVRVSTVLVTIALVAYIVAVWAMTTKPV
jgi:hypothetical protein